MYHLGSQLTSLRGFSAATETMPPFTEIYHSPDVQMQCTSQASRGLRGDQMKMHIGQQSRVMDAACSFKSIVKPQ
jgi:hypothetical protein